MPEVNSLRIHEKALLLILKDQEGTPAVLDHRRVLAGAILSELFLEGRLRSKGKGRAVYVADDSPTGDDILDDCVRRIASESVQYPTMRWIGAFSAIADLMHRVARQLCRRGILREDEAKVAFFFTRKVYPEVDPEPEAALVAELEEAIFTDIDEIAPHTAALVALGNATGLLGATFPRRRLWARRERLHAISRGEVCAAFAEAQDAMAAAYFLVVMPRAVTF